MFVPKDIKFLRYNTVSSFQGLQVQWKKHVSEFAFYNSKWHHLGRESQEGLHKVE